MSAQDCIKYPNLADKFNGKITGLLAQKSESYGCKNFIYLSTVHVYKKPLLGTFNEKSPTTNSHPYAYSHLQGENALLKVANKSSLTGTVLRLSNCFGYALNEKSECWNLVVNEFIRDAFLHGKIKIKGDASSKRDFLAISELNKVLLKIIENIDNVPQIINVSSGRSRTILEVALKVAKEADKLKEQATQILFDNESSNHMYLNIQNNSLDKIGINPNDDIATEIINTLNFLKLRESKK